MTYPIIYDNIIPNSIYNISKEVFEIALKTGSIQLKDVVWDFVGVLANINNSNVSAYIRSLVTEATRKHFKEIYLPRLRSLHPSELKFNADELNKELRVFLDVEGIDPKDEPLNKTFSSNPLIFQKALNYIEKRCNHVDADTIVAWMGNPSVEIRGIDVGGPGSSPPPKPTKFIDSSRGIKLTEVNE